MAGAVLLSVLCGNIALAQGKKKKEEEKEKIPVYNVVLDDPMDAFGRTPQPEPATTLLFPSFYSYNITYNKDTAFQYLCYDVRDSLINVDTLRDINLVRFISLFKSYTDPTHKYRDANGKEQPLPVSKIVKRYDKLGTNKWMTIDYANNKYTELKEYQDVIERTETATITHPVTKAQQARVHKYYRVSK